MTTTADTGQLAGHPDLMELDRRLSEHPDFGNDDLIIARAHGRLRLILDFVISRSDLLEQRRRRLIDELGDEAGQAVLDASVDHPVVKLQLENEARRWHYGGPNAADQTPAEVETVLLRALEACASRPSVGVEPYLLHGPDAVDDPLADDLEEACRQYFVQKSGTSGCFLEIDERQVIRIKDALRLAGELLPTTAPGALRHIRAIAVVDASTAEGRLLSAAGGDQFPGIILLDSGELSNVWDAAVRLLHEALHLKLFEISRATSIVGDPVDLVSIPWRHGEWEVRRVFFSFHVYAHLVALHHAIRVRSAELVDRYGDPPENAGVSRGAATTAAAAELSTPAGRGTWLGRQLCGPLRPKLTRDGVRMLTWLIDSIRPLLDVFEGFEGFDDVDDPGDEASRRDEETSADRRVRRGPDLLRREIPSAGTLAVLNPTDRSVHMLNLNSWLVLELCDGRSWSQLSAAHQRVVRGKVPPGTEVVRLESAVRELRRVGLVAAGTL